MRFNDLISSNQLYAILGKGIEGVKVIGINVLIARMYGPELFGKFSFILAVLSVIAVLAEFRLQSVLIREYSKKEIELGVLIGSGLVINLFFAITGGGLVYIYTFIEPDPVVVSGALIYSISFFYKIPRLFRAFFISIERNIWITKCEILASLLTIVGVTYLAFEKADFLLIVFARSLDFFLMSGLLLVSYILFSRKRNKIRFDFKVSKFLVVSSAPLVLSGAAMLLFQRIDIVLIRYYMGDYQAGLYSSITNIMTLFSLLPIVLSESLAPKVFKSIGTDDFDEISKKFSWIIISVGAVLSLLMILFAYPLVLILYGEVYLSAVPALLIMSVSPLLISLGCVAGQLIVAQHTQKNTYIKSIAGCIITILANFLLIPLFGLMGAAVSSVLGLLVANFFAHYFMPVYKNIFHTQMHGLKLTFLKDLKLPRKLIKNV